MRNPCYILLLHAYNKRGYITPILPPIFNVEKGGGKRIYTLPYLPYHLTRDNPNVVTISILIETEIISTHHLPVFSYQ